jgi:tetratricopeptide (TPR) repeat protein
MDDAVVSEEEIESAEKLRGQGDFANALALTQNMLHRVQDGDTRMRLLFDVLYCSTRLRADDLTSETIQELEQMPEPKMSRVFVDFIQAVSHIAFGGAQEALQLIEANLKTEFMEREDFRIWKYKHLAYKGSALVGLARCEEALYALKEAHDMYPDGERETAILIDQSNCLLALDQYDEAYNAASRVLNRDDGEMAVLATQYMAECRMWQARVPEALRLYTDVQKRLPCRLVEEERIRGGIAKCMAYLEKVRPQGKPS